MTDVRDRDVRAADSPDTDDRTAPRWRSARTWRPTGYITAATLLVAGLTAAVFLNRAGESVGFQTNPPVNFLLGQSDNTVLFQLVQDVFHGHPLAWQFSPQIFVFPEIPISFVAYCLAGGSLYGYLLVVAIINNCLLFGAVATVAKVLRPSWPLRDRLVLALFASTPLVLLPLLGHDNVFFYSFAAVYYFGAYLFMILAPLMVFAPSKRLRIAVGIGFALTVASDPLVLALAVPALAIALLATYLRDGGSAIVRPAVRVAVPVVSGYLVRTVLLSGLVAASPSSYISVSKFRVHLYWLDNWYRNAFYGPAGGLLKVLLFVGAAAPVIAGLFVTRRFFARRAAAAETGAHDTSDAATLTRLVVLLAPASGLVAMFLLLVLYQYYLWPIVVGSLVAVLLIAGRRVARYGATAALVLMLVLLLLPSSLHRYQHTNRYFKFVPALTQCMDRELPAGVNDGFATLSDARTYGLLSNRPLIIAQILGRNTLAPNYWMANKAYYQHFTGSFFFVANPQTAEPPIRPAAVRAKFGAPQQVRSCAGGTKLMIYTAPQSISLIHNYYRNL